MSLKKSFCRMFFRLNAHFFDNVCIKDQKLKNKITEWIFYLKYYKGISISKFSNLFSKFEGIVFPITIHGTASLLWIVDNSGENYYLSYSPLNYYKMVEYTIGKRVYPFDKEFVYHLTVNNEIILHEKLILQLNEDNTNSNNMVSFHYDAKSRVKTAVLKAETATLEITYSSSAFHLDDNQFSIFLLGLACNFSYIDDVSFVLQSISNLIKTPKTEQSLTIRSYTNNGKELLSEICISNGIVTKYSFTARPNDSEICFHKHTLYENLEDFILSHKR